MSRYVFSLGRNPALSILELVSYLQKEGKRFRIEQQKEEYVLATITTFNPEKAMHCLGGTVKIGIEVTDENKLYEDSANKIVFGVSYYSGPIGKQNNFFKEVFKSLGVRATQKYGKTAVIAPTKSVSLDAEFIVVRDNVFKVVATSNPKEYKFRDEKRPVFDPLKVTSIRLAKILINIAGAQKEIVDPFCGNGTILQEALLMGYNVIGCDLKTTAVNKNLRWLEQKYKKLHLKKKWTVLQGDVARLDKRLRKIECVVTEPYLGPYQKKFPSVKEAKIIARELRDVYRKALQALRKIVQKRVVIILPELLTREKKPVNLGLDNLIRDAGFRVVQPFPKIKLPLEYKESNTRIRRLVYVLEKF